MTTSVQPTEDEASRIWAQLDSEDAGTASADPGTDTQTQIEVQPSIEAGAVAAPAPAEQADATVGETRTEPNLSDDKIAGMQSMIESLTTRLRKAEGHIGDFNSQLKAAAQTRAQGDQSPTAAQVRAAQGSQAAMESLKRDYPEFATAMEGVLDEQRAAIRQELEAATSRAAPTTGVTQADLDAARNEMSVEVQHPGWKSLVKTPEFAGWLQRQPREAHLLASSSDPGDAVRLLDLHKAARANRPATLEQERLAAAAAIPTGRAGANTRAKPVEEMSKSEYWAHLDNVERQNSRR